MMPDSTGASNLETWFSSERMSAYNFHPDPEALYVWNTRVTKCFLEDIQHVEVLLRNCVDKAVSPRYGEHWYNNSAIPFTREAKRAVAKALKRVGATKDKMPSSGQVIAELSFDFWAYLFTSNYSSTIWPLVRKTLIATPTAGTQSSRSSISVPSLSDFKDEVDVAYHLRNRCAHHEPIIRKNRQEEEFILIDDNVTVIGSSNMDERSFAMNMEISLLIVDEGVTSSLYDLEEEAYVPVVKELNIEQWRKRSLKQKYLENVCRLTSSLL